MFAKTNEWLEKNLPFYNGTLRVWLIMRPPHDKRHSPELKPALLEEFRLRHFIKTEEILFCIDDRDDILAGYESAGYKVIKLAGDAVVKPETYYEDKPKTIHPVTTGEILDRMAQTFR